MHICTLQLIEYAFSTALLFSKSLESVWPPVTAFSEITVEILLPMTAGQSHNWLVDTSLSITDVSIGAEHWWKGIHCYIYNSTETQTVYSQQFFYLAKLTAYSIWHRYEICQETLLQGLFHSRSTGAVIGPRCFLQVRTQEEYSHFFEKILHR